MATLAEVGGWRAVIGCLVDGTDLDDEVAQAAVAEILSGEASPAQIGGFLAALQAKGASPAEVAAMVDAMLGAAMPLELNDVDGVVDIVGTGGSRLRQDKAFNISTTACFVVAGAGVRVCKHGNRRASSSSGSSDALEALGIAVELDGPTVARCVDEAGVGFAFARVFHPAMRHAGPVRAELGIPTVFNILGPLSHPGLVRRQVIGVANPALAPLVIDVLRRRGAPRAMVVHGSDGLDELTLTGPSEVHELRDGVITELEVLPQHLGLEAAVVEDVGVGSPEDNATAIREVLSGVSGARRDVVLLNAAAGLVVSGVVDELEAGLELAASAVDSGRAMAALERVVEVSNATAGAS
jgi:anthranilate phosphoribosyltransferase